jgi:hypothetical protein
LNDASHLVHTLVQCIGVLAKENVSAQLPGGIPVLLIIGTTQNNNSRVLIACLDFLDDRQAVTIREVQIQYYGIRRTLADQILR